MKLVKQQIHFELYMKFLLRSYMVNREVNLIAQILVKLFRYLLYNLLSSPFVNKVQTPNSNLFLSWVDATDAAASFEAVGGST